MSMVLRNYRPGGWIIIYLDILHYGRGLGDGVAASRRVGVRAERKRLLMYSVLLSFLLKYRQEDPV